MGPQTFHQHVGYADDRNVIALRAHPRFAERHLVAVFRDESVGKILDRFESWFARQQIGGLAVQRHNASHFDSGRLRPVPHGQKGWQADADDIDVS